MEHLNTAETYALKALSKGYVVHTLHVGLWVSLRFTLRSRWHVMNKVKSGMQSSVISEKNVQIMCDSPFIVKLHDALHQMIRSQSCHKAVTKLHKAVS